MIGRVDPNEHPWAVGGLFGFVLSLNLPEHYSPIQVGLMCVLIFLLLYGIGEIALYLEGSRP